MARSTAKDGDFLGLLTLGSMIENATRALARSESDANNMIVKREMKRLQAYSGNLLQRYRIAMEQYRILRYENLALRNHVEHLQRALERSSCMNDRLLADMARKPGR